MTMLRFTTMECQQLLPKVLIDYLWELAAESGAEDQTFLLRAKYTGTGEVQEILHRRDNYSSWRRVFGYQPVDATVEVRITNFGVVMSLVGEEETKAQQTKPREVSACSA